MSIYNIFARQLQDAFKSARSKYNEAFKKMDDAEKALNKLLKDNKAKLADDYEIKVLHKKLAYNEAKQEFDKIADYNNGVWADFAKEKARISKDFHNDLTAHHLITPQGLDANAVELLKAGILTSADYNNLAQTYANNPTMLKMISKYALEASKKDVPVVERRELEVIAHNTESGKTMLERNWDALLANADILSGQSHEMHPSPSYVCEISKNWESIVGEVVLTF